MRFKSLKHLGSFGPSLIITAAILWALDGIIRRSLYVLSPIVIVFYEHLIGFLIIAPIILKSIFKEKFSKKEIGLIAFISLFSSMLGTLWFTTALLKIQFISFSVVYLIQKLQPIFAISAARIFLKEKIDKGFVKWAALAVISAYFVTFKNGHINFQTGSETIIAAIYALGAAFAWGSSTAFSKMALLRKSPSVVTTVRFFFATVFAFVAVFVLGKTSEITSVNISQIGRFVFIAISTGMVALLIYYKGLKKTEAKVSTILELVYPLLAVIIDAFYYKSFLSPSQYIAGGVLLFAIYNISHLSSLKSKSLKPT